MSFGSDSQGESLLRFYFSNQRSLPMGLDDDPGQTEARRWFVCLLIFHVK